jgi:hypothetical protein
MFICITNMYNTSKYFIKWHIFIFIFIIFKQAFYELYLVIVFIKYNSRAYNRLTYWNNFQVIFIIIIFYVLFVLYILVNRILVNLQDYLFLLFYLFYFQINLIFVDCQDYLTLLFYLFYFQLNLIFVD